MKFQQRTERKQVRVMLRINVHKDPSFSKVAGWSYIARRLQCYLKLQLTGLSHFSIQDMISVAKGLSKQQPDFTDIGRLTPLLTAMERCPQEANEAYQVRSAGSAGCGNALQEKHFYGRTSSIRSRAPCLLLPRRVHPASLGQMIMHAPGRGNVDVRTRLHIEWWLYSFLISTST